MVGSDPNGVEERPAFEKMLRASAWVALLAGALLLSFRPLSDYDLPWNIATGGLLSAARGIPRVDDLAFSHAPLRYVEVLPDLAFYALDRFAGPLGLQVFGAAVTALAIAWSFLRMRRAGPLAYAMTAWLAAACASWFTVRPASVSLALLALLGLCLDIHRRDPAGRAGRRSLALLLPLFFCWSNVHGYVSLGAILWLGYAGSFVAGALLGGTRFAPIFPAASWRDARFVLLTTTLGIGAACINTMGPPLLLGPFRSHEALIGITEWAQPTAAFFLHDVPLATGLVGVSLVLILFGREEGGARALPAFDVGVAFLAFVGFFSVVRMTPVTLLLLAPIAARRGAVFFPKTSRIFGSIGAASLLTACLFIAETVPRARRPGFDEGRLPERAVKFIERVRPIGQMYNFMPYGGYLAYRLYPRYRVFMDGRNELAHDRDLIARAARASVDADAFKGLVHQFDLTWAVTSSTDGESFDIPLSRSRRWQMIYLDDLAAVYVRRDGPNRELGESGYRILRHLISAPAILDLAVKGERYAAELDHDGRLAAVQAPLSVRASFLAAAGALAIRDAVAFRADMIRLARLSPDHPSIAVLRRAAEAAHL